MFEPEGRALEKAVESTSSILIPFGFTVKKENELEYYAESDKIEIYIAHARTTVKIAVGPLSEPHGLFHSASPSLVELHCILEVLAPEMNESDRFPKPARSDEEMCRELDRQLHILVENCKPLLEGDPVVWARISDFMRDLGGLLKGDDETDEHYIRRLREIVAIAWERKEFWRVNGVYNSLYLNSAKLTIRDYYRWFQAERRTFLIG